VSHGEWPTFFDAASFLRRSYTDRICGDAGSVLGRANDAPIRALSEDESLDMAVFQIV
jgi:hypothetical protein